MEGEGAGQRTNLILAGVVLVSWETPAASRASFRRQGASKTGIVLCTSSSAAEPSWPGAACTIRAAG